MKHIPVGTMVTVEAPGSRGEEENPPRMIPAVVTGQWKDGSLELYAFHFEGAPILLRAVTLDRVHMIGQPEAVEKPPERVRTFDVA